MLIARMLKLSQQLNKLSKPILVYLAALQDVPGNPLNFATTLATAATTTTSYYVSSTCTESPTAVCQLPQFDHQKHHGAVPPTPFPYAYSSLASSSSSSPEAIPPIVWWGGINGGEEDFMQILQRLWS